MVSVGQVSKRVKGKVSAAKPQPPRQVQVDTTRKLLAAAAKKAGNYAELARQLGRSKGAVSQWSTNGDVPDHTLRLLELFVVYDIPLSGVVNSGEGRRERGDDEELQIRRRISKVQLQLTRLAWQTRAQGEKWEAIERLLDAWVPLTLKEVEQASQSEHEESGEP
jgi:transcriptional regulator with XRE-family HTH domain